MTGPGHADSHARFVEFVALMGMMMSLVAFRSTLCFPRSPRTASISA